MMPFSDMLTTQFGFNSLKKAFQKFLAPGLIFFLLFPFSHAQIQLGGDIDGEAAGNGSGISVSKSFDGSRVAIGALGNSGSAPVSGHVRVYSWSGTAWVQVGADIDGEAIGDQSGWSTSLSADGNRVAIGAPFNDGAGIDAGHVRVYDWNGTAWVQAGSDIDGEAANDRSAWAMALSPNGNRVAIGAPLNDGIGTDAGHVRVYNWNGTSWQQLGSDIEGEANLDNTGYAVALSANGSRVAIGAIGNDATGPTAGHVRVFDWNGTAWIQVGADIDGEAAGDQIGKSVALSANGNRLAAGAQLNDGNGVNAGHVRVFDWNGTAWVQVGADIDGEAAGDQAGWASSLSADGNRLAIGGPTNDGTAADAGHVRVYDWSGTNWVLIQNDIDGEALGDHFGGSVSLSGDGEYLAIGARYNDGIGTDAGHTMVYTDFTPLAFEPIGEIGPGLPIVQSGFQIGPNPCQGELSISLGNESESEIDFSLISVSGRSLFRTKLSPSKEEGTFTIDLSELSAGIYFYEVYSEAWFQAGKLIVDK
jgi:hypothetical protein